MPKIKTNRGAAKRFRKTASGRFKRAHAFHNHILTKKDAKRKASCVPPRWYRSRTRRPSGGCCHTFNID